MVSVSVKKAIGMTVLASVLFLYSMLFVTEAFLLFSRELSE